MLWLAGAEPELVEKVRGLLPPGRVPAAVLVPLVEREAGLTVLLTQRAATLKDHAGQISFPGGRIEAEDADPWHAALREAHEEIGLSANCVPDAVLGPLRVAPRSKGTISSAIPKGPTMTRRRPPRGPVPAARPSRPSRPAAPANPPPSTTQ